jgi:enhancing lycopene biosynthesis protein 2
MKKQDEYLLTILRRLSVEELETELDDIETDYRKKVLSTNGYNTALELTTIVLLEKRQERDTMDAYDRAMSII